MPSLSLGIVLGIGSVGTTAYWTDTATMSAGTIQAGSLDVQLDSNLAGLGGAWTNPRLAISGMVPGESLAVTVPVQRAAGSIGFTYAATATASGELASSVRWTVTDGTAGTAATNANGIRTNTCSGTTLSSNVTLGGNAQTVVPTRTLPRFRLQPEPLHPARDAHQRDRGRCRQEPGRDVRPDRDAAELT